MCIVSHAHALLQFPHPVLCHAGAIVVLQLQPEQKNQLFHCHLHYPFVIDTIPTRNG